jgi:DNA-binding GntR family transcriptional regulator
VRFVRNRGAVVCPLSIAEMREVFEVRKARECLAPERSVARLSEADFAKARYIIEQTAHADTPDALSRLNWDFHRSLFAGLDAGPLIAMIQRANVLADRYIRLHLALSGVPGRSQREHRQILAACRAGDTDKAAALMGAHLDKAIAKLEGYFRKHGLPG